MVLFALRASAIAAASLTACIQASAQVDPADRPAEASWSLVIHGGAGEISPQMLPADVQEAYRQSLAEALQVGAAILQEGGTAMDAVESVVRVMEDDPIYNAGRGSVFTAEGRNELDASIMDGASSNAGAVTGVTRVRHPITLARRVMENSPHVMFSGAGAESFAADQGLELVEPGFFFTDMRWNSLAAFMELNGQPMPDRPAEPEIVEGNLGPLLDGHKFGTVGAVARDQNGDMAAATSTGGMTGKRWGRVGDSPIVGAGTYAANGVCAVSSTGTGEYFIRLAVAYDICARVRHGGQDIQTAADGVIQTDLTALGGSGGVIALGPEGKMIWSFNSPGMFRARIGSSLEGEVAMFGESEAGEAPQTAP